MTIFSFMSEMQTRILFRRRRFYERKICGEKRGPKCRTENWSREDSEGGEGNAAPPSHPSHLRATHQPPKNFASTGALR
jgi:hypothetical protein